MPAKSILAIAAALFRINAKERVVGGRRDESGNVIGSFSWPVIVYDGVPVASRVKLDCILVVASIAIAKKQRFLQNFASFVPDHLCGMSSRMLIRKVFGVTRVSLRALSAEARHVPKISAETH